MDEVPRTARAIIGYTGYGTFGILWREFGDREYSGPFATPAEAEERARVIADHYGYEISVEWVTSLSQVTP